MAKGAALDLKALLKAVGYALDHVGHQRSGQAVEGTVLAAVRGAADPYLFTDLFDLDIAGHALG